MTAKTRAAKPEDLPAVVKVVLAAINKERLWTSFVPSKSGQDEQYYKEIEALLKEHLDPSNKDWIVEVIDIGGKKGPSQIVSVAIWDASSAEDGSDKKTEVKTTVSDSRLSAYTEVVDKARNEFFNRYPNHMYLQLLATHPDHQNHGYAKDLVHSHIVKMKQKGGVLTTLGGPFGYIFFSGLGFHDLGPITLPPSAAANTEAQVKAMSLTINKEERRQSIVDSVLNYISS